MAEGLSEDDVREILTNATRAGRAKMELATYGGVYKKEVREAFKDFLRASQLVERYREADSDRRSEIKEELSSILKTEWIREPDFDKLYEGIEIYDPAPAEFKVEVTEADKISGDYFFDKIVNHLLKKHKISQAELDRFIWEDEKAVSESELYLLSLKRQKGKK